MKKINYKQHFATTYRHLTKKNTAFVYQSTCLVHFTMLAPKCYYCGKKTIGCQNPNSLRYINKEWKYIPRAKRSQS